MPKSSYNSNMNKSKKVWHGVIEYPQDAPVFYWADPHLGHGNIILYCGRTPFMSPIEKEMYDSWQVEGAPRNSRPRISRETVWRMDEAIIAQVNILVPSDGVLALVGDFCFGPSNEHDYFAIAKRYREAIRCQNIHMIWGNHDGRCISPLFRWANEKATVIVGDHKVVLDHEAHYFWDGKHKGYRHYYGHSHAQGEEELDRIMPGRLSQDVGVDNAYRLMGQHRPFRDLELEEMIKTRSGYEIKEQDE